MQSYRRIMGMVHNHLVAIPVFNEEAYLPRVLDKVRRYSQKILVVDDGSTDSTPHLLRRQKGIETITHAENRGYGKSLADAFCFAQKRGYQWLITMDCDEQHEPECIPCFLRAAAEGNTDIISGTRYPGGQDGDSTAPADRRQINRIVTDQLNRVLGLNITDAFCGFKAYCVAALRHFHITVPGYAMPIQLWVQAARAGLRIRELPVRLIYNDPTRHFGGILDDPAVRLQHYLDVLAKELAVPPGHTRRDDCLADGRSTDISYAPCSTSRD
jgi:dolichol-phosphate mannosyltransferase